MKRIKAQGIPVIVFEPSLNDTEFFGSEVTHDLEYFKERCTVIVANRWYDELSDVEEKVYTGTSSVETELVPSRATGCPTTQRPLP